MQQLIKQGKMVLTFVEIGLNLKTPVLGHWPSPVCHYPERKWKKKHQKPVLSQVTTIYSALLLFIHHWYIVFWWNNWKNYPCYSLWRSTRTQILVWKTRKGGTKLLGGGLGYTLYTVPLAHHHLPVRGQSACIPTCTYWHSPDSHMRRETEPCCNI